MLSACSPMPEVFELLGIITTNSGTRQTAHILRRPGVDQPQQATHLFANRILLLQGQDHSGMLSTCIHPISMKRVKVPHVEAVEKPDVLNTPPKLLFVG